MWTIQRMLAWGTAFFTEKHVDSPRTSMEWLLSDALGLKRLDLYVQFDRPLSSAELDRLRPWVKRRAAHEPLQYITGVADFHRIRVKVDRSVLIPRPETEELVERILEVHPAGTERHVLDIGTGSGCIAIALKAARPEWTLHAVDVSAAALATAAANAELNHVDIRFSTADFLTGEGMPSGPFDLIVSNPPYIHKEESGQMHPQVLDYEPHLALFCENTDLVYGRLASYARESMHPNGALWVELNESRSGFESGGYPDGMEGETSVDSAGKTRFLKMWITC
jgi:release factor glutamine methyltransferase